MHPDLPITKLDEDLYERGHFARHLASCLLLPEGAPSIVVGIEGKWGEGKTSCINMIRKILSENEEKPIIVDYSPWLISTLDSLIEGFFVQLAATVGTSVKGAKATTATTKILQFAKMLAPIKLVPGVEPWGAIVERIISSVGNATQAGINLMDLSLQARKEDLQQHLGKLRRPIVVIIDDIDRLPPEHVRTVFQMLKAVTDFPRVAYLVAYDPIPVSQALSYNGIYDGRLYLEKLVQVSYPLPRLSFVHRKDHLEFAVNEILISLKIVLSQIDQQIWKDLLHKSDAIRLLSTPRDITRLINRLHLSPASVKNEVCFADIVAFQILELKYPSISQKIRQEPEIFLQSHYLDDELCSKNIEQYINIREMKEEKPHAILNELQGNTDYLERERIGIRSLLGFMFPMTTATQNSYPELPKGVNRICQPDAIKKFLHSGPTSIARSSSVATRFLTLPEEREGILDEWITDSDIADWLSFVQTFFVYIRVNDPKGLVSLLIKKYRPDTSLDGLDREIARFIYDLIKVLEENERKDLLIEVIECPHALDISHALLVNMLFDAGIWENGVYRSDDNEAKKYQKITDLPVPHDDLYNIKGLWLKTVRDAFKDDYIIYNTRDPISIFYRFGQLNNNVFDEITQYIQDRMADINWLRRFMPCLYNLHERPPFLPEGFFEHVQENLSDDPDVQLFLRKHAAT